MNRYFLRRFGASLLLLFITLSITFLFVRVAPGGPEGLMLDPRISADKRAEILARWGLDRPLHEQYFTWLGAVLGGDWGLSFVSKRPALEILFEKLPATLLLAVAATLIEHGVGMPLGLWAARRVGTWTDRAIRIVSLVLFSVPMFWLGLLAIEVLAVRWPLFPPAQMVSLDHHLWPAWRRALDLLHHLVLPALILGLARSGAVMRFCRNGLLDTLEQDYVRTARAKGLSESRVLWLHALPNTLLPLIQRLGVSLPVLLSGSVVIEVIFSWPGIGFTSYFSIQQRDYPVVLAATALSTVLVIVGNLMADLLHAAADPRVRYPRSEGAGPGARR